MHAQPQANSLLSEPRTSVSGGSGCLQAMGRRVGVEVSVNTSLNVGSPIVQTPEQALDCLKRSKGMTALWMIGSDGEVFLVWHDVRSTPKDGGERLRSLVETWRAERLVSR